MVSLFDRFVSSVIGGKEGKTAIHLQLFNVRLQCGMNTEANKVIGLYRRNAVAWARLRGSYLLEQKWLNKFMDLLPEAPSILDVGCAPKLGEPNCLEHGLVSTKTKVQRSLLRLRKSSAIKHATDQSPGNSGLTSW